MYVGLGLEAFEDLLLVGYRCIEALDIRVGCWVMF